MSCVYESSIFEIILIFRLTFLGEHVHHREDSDGDGDGDAAPTGDGDAGYSD
jgi:hypothetical protein